MVLGNIRQEKQMPIEKAAPTPDGDGNDRETGARKFPAVPGESDRDKEGLEAAENRGSGLAEPLSDTPEKTRKSEGQDQPTRYTATAEEVERRPRDDATNRQIDSKNS
jgi:hypothetical protein